MSNTAEGARAAGYIRLVYISGPAHDRLVLVQPEVDFDSRFKAWDVENEKWLTINGCLLDVMTDYGTHTPQA